jgi:hypothetical protein
LAEARWDANRQALGIESSECAWYHVEVWNCSRETVCLFPGVTIRRKGDLISTKGFSTMDNYCLFSIPPFLIGSWHGHWEFAITIRCMIGGVSFWRQGLCYNIHMQHDQVSKTNLWRLGIAVIEYGEVLPRAIMAIMLTSSVHKLSLGRYRDCLTIWVLLFLPRRCTRTICDKLGGVAVLIIWLGIDGPQAWLIDSD